MFQSSKESSYNEKNPLIYRKFVSLINEKKEFLFCKIKRNFPIFVNFTKTKFTFYSGRKKSFLSNETDKRDFEEFFFVPPLKLLKGVFIIWNLIFF